MASTPSFRVEAPHFFALMRGASNVALYSVSTPIRSAPPRTAASPRRRSVFDVWTEKFFRSGRVAPLVFAPCGSAVVVLDSVGWHAHRLAQEESWRRFHPGVRLCTLGEIGPRASPEFVALVAEKMPGYVFAPKAVVAGGAFGVRRASDLLSIRNVLFFADARCLAPSQFLGASCGISKMACSPSDRRLLCPSMCEAAPLNAGFCLFGRAAEWEEALEPLRSFTGVAGHISEQTLVHNMMHLNGAHELPPERYRLEFGDSVSPRDNALDHPTVLRHYVGSVRHKMWLHKTVFYS